MSPLAVLVSGTGSLLEAMIAEELSIGVVIADRPCRGLQIAEEHGIPNELIARTDFVVSSQTASSSMFDRPAYTEAVIEKLHRYQTRLVAMAGFMTILSPRMFKVYGGHILNTHPSLLPEFKGDHAVRDALAAGVSFTGCTIHIATAEVDEGPILWQQQVRVEPDDTEETLHERIKKVERVAYPAIIREQMEKLAA